MEPKDMIAALRQKHGFSQQNLADQVFVTRQAVSRWESGETIPGPDTLKLLSRLFNVSINTLLGAPRGFRITVRNLKVSAGAGFIVALTGDIMTMPGLPKVPAAEKIDIDENGVISGLF